MKKSILSVIIAILLAETTFCQINPVQDTASLNSKLFDFNKSRNRITSNGLKALGVWSVANVGASSYGYYNSHGSDEYFNQMNVMWNSVNIAIVAASLLPKQKNNLDFIGSLKAQHSVETIYISNAVLDLVYSSIGLYLTEKAKSDIPNAAKWNGWGNSLIMQGGFLFLLDTSMFMVHKKHGKKIYKMIDGTMIH